MDVLLPDCVAATGTESRGSVGLETRGSTQRILVRVRALSTRGAGGATGGRKGRLYTALEACVVFC